nr:vacuolar morphogenesis protein 7 like [Quercus suber]
MHKVDLNKLQPTRLLRQNKRHKTLHVTGHGFDMAPALQISIPTASTAELAGSKPYTVYHIVLQLPLRKHETRKRYTDFTTLHAQLTSQTGASPPAPLPAKSWLRRTVNNAALTEERRQGLERYVKSIIESEDARWRSSSPWRSFLNLSSGMSTMSADGTLSKTAAGRPGSQNGAIQDPTQWLEAHRDLKTQIQTARSKLKQREAATTPQVQHSMSAEAKASLVRAAASIAQLDDALRSMSAASKGDDAGWGGAKKLGDNEIRRRRDLVSAAKKEVEGLEGLLKSMATKNAQSSFNNSTAATTDDKEALWRGTSAAKPRGRVLGGPPKETERTRELDNSGVLQLQQQIMQEQDEDVLSLGKTVAKLKDMGILINEELAIQNEMLGLMEQDADRLQGKIDVGRRRIGKIS